MVTLVFKIKKMNAVGYMNYSMNGVEIIGQLSGKKILEG